MRGVGHRFEGLGLGDRPEPGRWVSGRGANVRMRGIGA